MIKVYLVSYLQSGAASPGLSWSKTSLLLFQDFLARKVNRAILVCVVATVGQVCEATTGLMVGQVDPAPQVYSVKLD